MVTGPEQTRVLVVSESPLARYVVSGELSSESDLFVVGTARNLDEAACRTGLLRPDLLIVDLESPHDLSDLQQRLGGFNSPVLALCGQNPAGADVALAALEAGVIDVVARTDGDIVPMRFGSDLVRKLRCLGRTQPLPRVCHWPDPALETKSTPRHFEPGDRVVAVSASTGGVGPLVNLLATLSPELPVAMLVLAPLPECYLYRFLQRVDPLSRFNLVLARDGLPLKSGVAYLVPYDYGVSVGSRGSLAVGLCARQNHGFSSVDAMLSSLATRYGPAVIGVILAGSGHDGVAGAVDVRAAGGTVIVQDQATCLVCETPAAVIQAGAATSVVPLEQIADEIARYVSHNQADSPAMLRSR